MASLGESSEDDSCSSDDVEIEDIGPDEESDLLSSDEKAMDL